MEDGEWIFFLLVRRGLSWIVDNLTLGWRLTFTTLYFPPKSKSVHPKMPMHLDASDWREGTAKQTETRAWEWELDWAVQHHNAESVRHPSYVVHTHVECMCTMPSNTSHGCNMQCTSDRIMLMS
eukprot:scaffold133765_cov60-Attheya_sp.AAC.12